MLNVRRADGRRKKVVSCIRDKGQGSLVSEASAVALMSAVLIKSSERNKEEPPSHTEERRGGPHFPKRKGNQQHSRKEGR